MAGYKINRVTSDIKICLSELLREVKDPRVSKLISIVKLDISGDMSYAAVYVSAIEGEAATKESVKALNKSASGFLRRELGARMKLRKVPELRFVADNSIEKSSEILGIIKSFEKDTLNGTEGDTNEQTM
ncbi:MAG: 30S ribosome-binding factor RbfA [Clostridia bacterium]|nr:30S ribosome-binding factor RbfA [Clostridia bacterium]